jgi:hypothetical protein
MFFLYELNIERDLRSEKRREEKRRAPKGAEHFVRG